MSKPLLGVVLGTVLGLLDGLSAFLSPEAAPMMLQIVVGSTIKGLVTGLLAGLFARKMRSIPLGVAFALVVGLILSYLAAMTPDPQGKHHYVEIMLPGALLAAIVGFATQRYGQGPRGGGAAARAGLVLLLVGIGAGSTSAAEKGADASPFTPIQFLVGDWQGTSEGQPGKGSVERTYRFVLGDKFLHERNVSTYPPQPKNAKGEVHEHWSFFSTITFETEAIENIPAGWKARETYKMLSSDEFLETFELAEGDKPFEVYSTTRFKRTRKQ